MKSFEDNTHAFVVRVWLEPREIEDAPPEWRGVVEHVPSGERRYLRDLNEIEPFISKYLHAMGVKSRKYQRIVRWLRQWKPSFIGRH